jgi:hypothetical protein
MSGLESIRAVAKSANDALAPLYCSTDRVTGDETSKARKITPGLVGLWRRAITGPQKSGLCDGAAEKK